MADPSTTEVAEAKGFFTFERTVQLAPYSTAKASLMIQFPVDLENGQATVDAAKEAAFQAKTVVYDELGIEVEYDKDKGVLREVLGTVFGSGVEVVQQQNPPAARAQSPAPAARPQPTRPAPQAAPSGDVPPCPKCNGPMWDNRATKKGKQPDFKCKNGTWNPQTKTVDGCDGVLWAD